MGKTCLWLKTEDALKIPRTHNLEKAFMLATESYLKPQAPVDHLGLISSLFYILDSTSNMES